MADQFKKTNPFLPTESKHDVIDIFADPPKNIFPESVPKCEAATDSLSSQSHFESTGSEDPKTLFGFVQQGGSSSSTFKNPNIFGGKIASPKQLESSWRSSGMPDNHKDSTGVENTAVTKGSGNGMGIFSSKQPESSWRSSLMPDNPKESTGVESITNPVFGSYTKKDKAPKPTLFGGVSSMGNSGGFSSAPSGISSCQSGFSSTPSGISSTPSVFSSAPSQFSSTPSIFSSAASVFSSAQSGVSSAPSGFSSTSSGVSTTPSGFPSPPSTSSIGKVSEEKTKPTILQKPALVFGSKFSSTDSSKSGVASGSALQKDSTRSSLSSPTSRPSPPSRSSTSRPSPTSRSSTSRSSPTSSRRIRHLQNPDRKESDEEEEPNVSSAKEPPEVFFQTESSTLVAVEIPDNYLEKSILYNHFSKFGTVKKVLINRRSNQASICFGDHKSASLAKAKGKKLHPLVPEMKLFFGAVTQPPKKKISLRKTPLELIKSEFSSPKKVAPASRIADFVRKESVPEKSKVFSLPEKSNVFGAPEKSQVFGGPEKSKVFGGPEKSKGFGAPEKSKMLSVPEKSKVFTVPEKSKVFTVPEKSKVFSLPKKTESRDKAPSGNLGSVTNLSVLMNSQANNNYDKFLILDARDKNMRAKQEKVMDVKKAHYLSATCPDMCPEKERYSRDIQYDISIYETSNQKMDPKLVVKKFSRSSADKDEPLPHELRPGPVLKMTMDFLTCNIISKGDEEDVQADYWYNFLCNRTRALRNDIMQQHLQESNAVYVLEKCIRFHIHCSHQLCEENVENFDPKVNFEHLGKSLQSLKELYQDLGEKGVYFETESEFRGYEVLLNVNDGNVIFRYLKFRKAVRNSDHVQFAVKVLYAVSSNNYAKFFKLLKEAGYLEACIMHKSFQNIRMKALAAITKAFVSQSLPIEKIMNVLNFSTKSKCQAYLEPFGLEVTEDCKVYMDKVKFVSKPSPLPSISMSEAITAKKRVPLGEIIQNGPLPINPVYTYEPHDSFDSKGKLNPAAVDALDQASTKRQGKDAAKCKLEETSKEILIEMENKRLLKELTSKVDEMYRQKLGRKYLTTWRNNVKKQLEQKRIKTEKTLVFVKLIGKVWRKKTARNAELVTRADNHLKTKYFLRWISYVEYRREIKGYLERAEAVKRRLLMKKYVSKWKNFTTFKKSVHKANVARRYLVSLKYFQKWKIYTKFSIAERKSNTHYQLKLLRSCFDQWKIWCSMFGSRNKFDFSSFPASGSQFLPKEQNQLLDWGYDRDESLDMSAQQILELNEAICTKSKTHYSLQQLSGLIAWSALPILQRFQADINSRPPDFSRNIFARYFKIVILVEPGIDSYLLEWIRTKFNILEVDDLSSPLQCKVDFNACHDGTTYSVIVSERDFTPPYNFEVNDASLVVFAVNESNLKEVNTIVRKLGEVPNLIFCRSLTEDVNSDKWMMTKRTIDDPFTSEKLFYVVLKFWQNRTQRLNLQKGKCNEVVTEFISKTVLFPVYQVVSHRKLYRKLLPCPNEIVELYNSSILHIRDSFHKYKSYQWPPKELLYLTTKHSKLWNNEDTKVVMSALQTALLPRFSILPTPSWHKIEEQLANFIKEVGGVNWNGNLHSEVRNILKIFRSETKNLHEDFDTHIPFHEIPWVDILNACIFFKLSLIPPTEIGYSHHDLYSLNNKERLSRLRSSKITHLAKEDTPVKRKVPFYLPLEPKKPRREKPPSLLLMDLQHEKEISLKYEEDLDKMVLLDKELEALFSQNCTDLSNSE